MTLLLVAIKAGLRDGNSTMGNFILELKMSDNEWIVSVKLTLQSLQFVCDAHNSSKKERLKFLEIKSRVAYLSDESKGKC